MELEKLFALGLIKMTKVEDGFILVFDTCYRRDWEILKCLVMLKVAGDKVLPAVPYVPDRHSDFSYFFRPATLNDARAEIRIWRPGIKCRVFNRDNYLEEFGNFLKSASLEYFEFQDNFNNNEHLV